MNIQHYKIWHDSIWLDSTEDAKLGDLRAIAIPAMGLSGEAGEVTEHFKKHIRDGKPLVGNVDLKLELGDVFNYWLQDVKIAGLTMEEVLQANHDKISERRARKCKVA